MSRYARAFIATALLALLGAASLHLLAAAQVPGAWAALVHLTLFGWITGMIMAVSYHTMPVFSGRIFPTITPIWLHWAAFSGGLALATIGILLRWPLLELSGLALQCLGGLLFIVSTVLLFVRGSRQAPHPTPPIADQARVDRVGTSATKVASLALPLVLALLIGVRAGALSDSWTLAAEHLMALGWVMLMIVGVAYHVLPRFSGQATRGFRWARGQLLSHLAAVLLIVLGLGMGWPQLFAFGGVLMALALAMFAWTIWPTLQAIRVRAVPIRLIYREPTP
jgi:hypothetical protein